MSFTKNHRSFAELLQKAREYERVFGRRGLWLAVRTKFTHAERLERASVDGTRHSVQIRLNSSDLSTFVKIFLNREYEIPLAKEPAVIIDAGANVGYAAVFFALKYPNARIIAIEPETVNFAVLKQNTAAFPNILPVKAALWPTSGYVDLLDPGMGSWGFEAADPNGPKSNHAALEKVRAITIGEILNEFGLPSIDILKIDIEGGEKTLFAGPPAWLERVGVIMIELHDQRQPGCTRNFFVATREFEREIRQGETVAMLRPGYIQR
jgi:FkbM family methyltransferase